MNSLTKLRQLMRTCCGHSVLDSSESNPFKQFASHRELLRSQGYDGPLHPLLPSGPGKFEAKASETADEPTSWAYNRLVQMEYSLGGTIGWQLASSMAEADRSLNVSLPPEINELFPRRAAHRWLRAGPKNDPVKTDMAVRKAQQFFPVWYTNAVKCHEGPTYTTKNTQEVMGLCVDCYLKEEMRIIQPSYFLP